MAWAALGECFRKCMWSPSSHPLISCDPISKTVCAVAICKDVAIREHFSKFAWVSIGQEAAIEELQDTMMMQITGKAIPAEAAAEKNRRLKFLQKAAMQLKGRLLVVLDDPWLPEQVQLLNPLDLASPSKLFITTRIRGLVTQAVEVPLELLKVEESAEMLMEIGQVDEADYRAQNAGTEWPPRAALSIASECGNLPLTVSWSHCLHSIVLLVCSVVV